MKTKYLILLFILFMFLAWIKFKPTKECNEVCSLNTCSPKICTLPIPPGNFHLKKDKKQKLPLFLEVRKKDDSFLQASIFSKKLRQTFQKQFTVIFVDASNNIAVVKKYKITTFPTQLFLDSKGKELFRHTGNFSQKEILKQWKKLGYSFSPSVIHENGGPGGT